MAMTMNGIAKNEGQGRARVGELRVLIVTDQYEPMVGGVPTVTRELARGLAERGHAVELLAPRHRPQRHRRWAGADRGLTVARRRSVRWPWYEDQRLGLLGRAAAASWSTASRRTWCTFTRR